MTKITKTIKTTEIHLDEYNRLKFEFDKMIRKYQNDSKTPFVMDYDTWDKLFAELYEQENHTMKYLSKNDLMSINETWKIEYEEKDMLL